MSVPCAALGVASCIDLPAIEPACGNGFVEEGEDCDEPAGSTGLSCGQPDTENACKWSCNESKDCSNIDSSHGWGCGVDHVCRFPAGEFKFWGEAFANEPSKLDLADFDGDGRLDVLAEAADGLNIFFFDAEGAASEPINFPAKDANPGVGTLVSKEPAAFSFSTGPGLAVLMGQSQRTFKPTFNASVSFPPMTKSVQAMPLRVVSPAGTADNVMLISDDKGTLINYYGATSETPMYRLSTTPDAVEGGIPSGAIDESPLSPCDEFVLANKEKQVVRVYTTCAAPGLLVENQDETNWLSQIPAPSLIETLGRPFLLDVDGDSHLDLLVSAVPKALVPRVEVYVAYGKGDGHFQSALGIQDTASIYMTITDIGSTEDPTTYLPLAVADLNSDGIVDFVDSHGVYVSAATGGLPPKKEGYKKSDYSLTGAPSGIPWSRVIIADLNANGILDVAAGAESALGIDFLNGAGDGLFNPFKISTLGGVAGFAAGDFDGDLIADLAFIERELQVSQGQRSEDALKIAFGRSSGAPETPISMGQLGGKAQLTSAILSDLSLDVMADLLIVSGETPDANADPDAGQGQEWSLSLALGNSARQLQTPLILIDPMSHRLNVPTTSAIGRFLDQGDQGIIVVAAELSKDAKSLGQARPWYVGKSSSGASSSSVRLEATSVGMDQNTDPKLYAMSPIVEPIVVDLNNDGKDEVIFSGLFQDGDNPVDTDHYIGGLNVVEFVRGEMGQGPPVSMNIRQQALTMSHALFLGAVAGNIGTETRIGPDVVAILVAPSQYSTAGYEKSLVVFPNQNGALGAPVTVTGFAGIPEAFTLVNADKDAEREIVVVVTDTETSPPTQSVYLLDCVGACLSQGGGSFESKLLGDVKAGEAIAGGDIDGDGVDDLVITGQKSIIVYKGVAGAL